MLWGLFSTAFRIRRPELPHLYKCRNLHSWGQHFWQRFVNSLSVVVWWIQYNLLLAIIFYVSWLAILIHFKNYSKYLSFAHWDLFTNNLILGCSISLFKLRTENLTVVAAVFSVGLRQIIQRRLKLNWITVVNKLTIEVNKEQN